MLNFSSSISKFLAGREGSVTVEFVAALPILIGSLVFCYEFARAFLAYEIATSDIQSAARYLSHVSTVNGAQYTAAVTTAQNIAMCGAPSGTCTPQSAHWPWYDSSVTPSVTNSPPSVVVIDCTQTSTCANFCTNIGTNCQPFNQDVTELQIRGDIQMTLSLLGYLGLGKIYTMHVVDKTLWIGS